MGLNDENDAAGPRLQNLPAWNGNQVRRADGAMSRHRREQGL